MKVSLVTQIKSFLHTSRIDSFHYTMFHGIACRREKNDFHLNALNHLSNSPLELILNDFKINSIIQPNLNLLATELIASTLENRFGLQTKPVFIKGTASIKYEEGNMEHWKNPAYYDDGDVPEKLLRKVAHRPNSNKFLFWEILPYDGEMTAEENPKDAFHFHVAFKQTGDIANVDGTISSLATYGLSWSDGVHCFRSDIFEFLEQHIHKDYFLIERLTV